MKIFFSLVTCCSLFADTAAFCLLPAKRVAFLQRGPLQSTPSDGTIEIEDGINTNTIPQGYDGDIEVDDDINTNTVQQGAVQQLAQAVLYNFATRARSAAVGSQPPSGLLFSTTNEISDSDAGFNDISDSDAGSVAARATDAVLSALNENFIRPVAQNGLPGIDSESNEVLMEAASQVSDEIQSLSLNSDAASIDMDDVSRESVFLFQEQMNLDNANDVDPVEVANDLQRSISMEVNNRASVWQFADFDDGNVELQECASNIVDLQASKVDDALSDPDFELSLQGGVVIDVLENLKENFQSKNKAAADRGREVDATDGRSFVVQGDDEEDVTSGKNEEDEEAGNEEEEGNEENDDTSEKENAAEEGYVDPLANLANFAMGMDTAGYIGDDYNEEPALNNDLENVEPGIDLEPIITIGDPGDPEPEPEGPEGPGEPEDPEPEPDVETEGAD